MIHPELLSRLCRARDLLRDWEDEPLSVIAVARVSGLTRFHFIRLFKAVFGETPHQYRSRAQIEKAKHLLILTDLSITDVCMAVGFSSLGSFSALFSRRVKTTLPPVGGAVYHLGHYFSGANLRHRLPRLVEAGTQFGSRAAFFSHPCI